MALMTFLTGMSSTRELHIYAVPDCEACIRVGACEGFTYSMPRKVYDFSHGIKVLDLVAGTQLTPVFALLATRLLSVLYWVNAEGPGYYFYNYHRNVKQTVPLYW